MSAPSANNTLKTVKLLMHSIIKFLVVNHVVVNILWVEMIGKVCPGGQHLSLVTFQQLGGETWGQGKCGQIPTITMSLEWPPGPWQ